MSSRPYAYSSLLQFTTDVLLNLRLTRDRAEAVATTLVEADLMGHDTHGLALLPPYVAELQSGGMQTTGEPIVVRDTGNNVTWDGQKLPGAWLTHRAIELARERVQEYGVVTVVVRNSHHIGSLASYPEAVARDGLFLLLSCSDPSYRKVAPFGGLEGVYSPNPIAAGIPTEGDPIIMDISTSATASGAVAKAQKSGRHLPAPWLLDHRGRATDDPAVFNNERGAGGTILPLGGMDSGYKGFALGLLVEALTGALAGYGRADGPEEWSSTNFLQLIDPEVFGGGKAFRREMQALADQSRAAQPISADAPVRLPGERALQRKKEQLEKGILLAPHIEAGLRSVAESVGLPAPLPLR